MYTLSRMLCCPHQERMREGKVWRSSIGLMYLLGLIMQQERR